VTRRFISFVVALSAALRKWWRKPIALTLIERRRAAWWN
jgi:hypothetical protein